MKKELHPPSPGHKDTQLLRDELFRKERIIEQRQGTEIKVDGKWLLNFCSNNYLGLASHTRIKLAMQAAADRYGTGSTASPLVCGKSALHFALEQKLASITGRDRALLLSCGYMANLAILSALTGARDQQILADRHCHASMVDGAMTSRSVFKRYPHSDPAALEQLLRNAGDTPALVLTESVFSMDGDIAPLPALARICRSYQACLVVDDAHGFGVLGREGLGGLDHFSLGQTEVPLMMATFGKALGVYGAFIAGPDQLIETLVQRARPYVYSTALPPPVIAAVYESLDVMREEPGRRQRLLVAIHRFQSGAARLGIPVAPFVTPIQPVIIGDAGKAVLISELLEQDGFFIRAIRPPTVPTNTSRLRITLSADHDEQQIDGLLRALGNRLTEAGIISG